MNALLLSNSTNYQEPYLGWCQHHIGEFLSGCQKVIFIPYAGVTIDYPSYTEQVNKGLIETGIKVTSIETVGNKKEAIESADAVVVGGGNTFVLLKKMYENKLIELIKEKVKEGTKYVGWSAGSNVSGKGINTSNDMPIAYPPSFEALGLVPWMINPHYTDKVIEGHNGESRMQRLKEFLVVNSEEVLTMEEGSGVLVNGSTFKKIGDSNVALLSSSGVKEIVCKETYSF